MRMLAVVAVLGVTACAATPPGTPAAVDPVEAFRPACRERWTTVFAVEKCALDAYEASRSGAPAATPVSAAPAAAPSPAAAPAAAPARPATGNQPRR